MSFSVETRFLDPSKLLSRATAEYLAQRSRDDCGAMSLARFLVVVPTAQSGRVLRRNLAAAAAAANRGGILPPRIVLAPHLAKPREFPFEPATGSELKAAFLSFAKSGAMAGFGSIFRPGVIPDSKTLLSFLRQLSDIWRALSGRALTMQDVMEDPAAREFLEGCAGDEAQRWRDLAAFERDFFDSLHSFGKCHRAEYVKAAAKDPAPLDGEIEEIILPQLCDPVSVMYGILEKLGRKTTVLVHADPRDAGKFDKWGRPLTEAWETATIPSLAQVPVVRTGTDRELAVEVASDFPLRSPGCAMPALGMVDSSLYPELAAAFLDRPDGAYVHNPAMHRLRHSSLGHIVSDAAALYAPLEEGFEWGPFSRLLKADDVLRRILRETGTDREHVLAGLDIYRNARLPVSFSVPESDEECAAGIDHPKDRDAVLAFAAAARTLAGRLGEFRRSPLVQALALFVDWVFAGREEADDPASREFFAAMDCLSGTLEELSSAMVSSLAGGDISVLAASAVSDAAYSLEADGTDAIVTEGWLELQWSDRETVALAGFHEGSVPDSVIGHPFLPDALREVLKLTSNRQRYARDAYLMSEMLSSRDAASDVRIYVSHSAADGTIHKPGRLLFMVDDSVLAARVEALYGDVRREKECPPRRVAADFRLSLPDEVAFPGKISPSAIDRYLVSPFAYLLQYPLDMRRRYKEKEGLGFDDFGNFMHAVLERFARERLECAKVAPFGRDAICARLLEIAEEEVSKFGTERRLDVDLQLEAAKGRLGFFADVQDEWDGAGWKVAFEPEYGFDAAPFTGGIANVRVAGKIDRIDMRIAEDGRPEYRIIDYKTWDDCKLGHVAVNVSKSGPDKDLADSLFLPTFRLGGGNGKEMRFVSVQLPLYARCLEVSRPDIFAGRIADMCYLVLGEGRPSVLGSAFKSAFARAKDFVLADLKDTAFCTAQEAVRLIGKNIFWPPGSGPSVERDISYILLDSPEKDLQPRPGDADYGRSWLDRQKAKLAALADERRA